MKTFKQKNDGQYNSKANTVCLLKILEAYSDGNIILPMSRIIELMESVYGLHVDRRTIYSSIGILQQLKYPIETYEDNGIGYCMTDKIFDTFEIKVLIDSLYLNRLVPTKVERTIMRKLIGFIPTKEKRYCFGNVIRNAKKEKDSALFLVLDTIDVATQQKKKIEFDYMTKDGTLSRLIQTPLEIHHVNNSYYVVCLNFDTKQIVRYLLKNIKNVSISLENADKWDNLIGFSAFDEYGVDLDYVTATFKVNSDIEEKFIEIFDNVSLRHKNIEYSTDNKTFTVKVLGTIESLSRYALAYADKCEVIEPQEIRDLVIDKIKNNKYGV